MLTQEDKYCPRCHATFECKSADILNCQCNSIHLRAETLVFLEKTYFGCLCASCLSRIDEAVKTAENYEFPVHRAALVEGLHYYVEKGNWVFTELYHLLRGSCCGNGCRHCVYSKSPDNQLSKQKPVKSNT